MTDIREAIHKAAKAHLSGLFNAETAEKIAAGIAKEAEEPVLDVVTKAMRVALTAKPQKKKKQKKGTAAAAAAAAKNTPPAETPPAPAEKPAEAPPAAAPNNEGDALNLI